VNILVLGAKGMAGHVIYDRLVGDGHTVIGTSRFASSYKEQGIVKFDALDVDSWFQFFESLEVDVIVNCIGMLVKACENNIENAVTVNTLLPYVLEELYRGSNTQVIHISTDCVFDGKTGNYTDDTFPNETHIYGKSKHRGEIRNDKDLTIRTSIIGLELGDKPNSKDNSGLIHWFLSQPKGSFIQGYSECYWSGISTLELADAIVWYLENPSHGLHQVSRDKKISKFDLLTLANGVFERELIIEVSSEKKVDKSLIPSERAFKVEASYLEMLERMRLERKNK
jgi:dTDP-4-dehydrorhamnose reductase